METNTILVRMAEWNIAGNSTLLKTTLGSCVGIVLHDHVKSQGGLAHIMLPEQINGDKSTGKYANTAIPELLTGMLQRGSKKEDLRALLAGGANMFKWISDKKISSIGEKNIEAARRVLKELGIPITYEDVGGENGRTVVFDSHLGEIKVKKLNKVPAIGENS